jgi:hypothetical protein
MAVRDHSDRASPWPPDPPGADSRRKRTAEEISATELSDAEKLLGKLAQRFTARVRDRGWRRTVSEERGKSNITSTVTTVPHKAAWLVGHLARRGASIVMTTLPWDEARRQHAILWGPHKSSDGERKFVCDEMIDFCEQGYWMVLPYDAVAHLPLLRISPLGVVP